MIFYGTGTVWDVENKRVLCEFVDGIYITNDDREIKILMGLDYRYIVAPQEVPQQEEVSEVETVKEEGEVVEPIEISTVTRTRKRKNNKCEENDSN